MLAVKRPDLYVFLWLRGSQSFPTPPVLALAQEGSECGAQFEIFSRFCVFFSPGFVLFLGKTFGFPKNGLWDHLWVEIVTTKSRLFPGKAKNGFCEEKLKKENEKKQELQQKHVFNGIMEYEYTSLH